MKYLIFIILPIFVYGQKLEKMAEGLNVPWGMVFLNKDQILLTERSGSFKVYSLSSKKISKVNADIKVEAVGQGGLLDVALAPDFPKSQRIFFTYSKKIGSKNTTALAKAQLTFEGNSWSFKSIEDLFVAQPAVAGTNLHFGSRLIVTDQEIWMTVGERNMREFAQDLSVHLGKVLRLNHSGQAMPDNPFVNREGVKPEIWSYGHRNPQGLLKHPETGDIWEHEHGPRGGDEINLIKKGANYGWPLVSYGREYSGGVISESPVQEGIEKPLFQYTPSIAPSGFVYYGGKKIKPFQNSFLIGALALTHLSQIPIKQYQLGPEKKYFQNLNPRIREVEVGPDDLIYFSTDAGEIWRVIP